jgi:hypothetical protein
MDAEDTDEAQHESSPESVWRTLGVTHGLLLAGGLFLWLTVIRGGSIDGEERLRELFGENNPPFGLIVAEAAKLPTGDVLLQLRGPSEVGAEGPEEVVLIEYASRAAVSNLFVGEEEASETMQTWSKDPSFGWKAILERDEIQWGVWRTDFARVRHFAKGGGWIESARVDLTQPARNLALIARWGEKEEIDRSELLELLGSIEMLDAEEEG